MEALADAIGLRAFGLGSAVVDVLDREVELVFVAFAAAEFGAHRGWFPIRRSRRVLPMGPRVRPDDSAGQSYTRLHIAPIHRNYRLLPDSDGAGMPA